MQAFAIAGALVVAYGVGLILVNLSVFLWLFVRSPQHRWPVTLMLFGQFASRALYLLDVARRPPPTLLDPAVFAVLVPFTTYAIALFGFHIFDPLPTARQMVMEQMLAGVVVFDAGWRVVSLNPAAEWILGVRNSLARGKTWQQLAPPGGLLPTLPDASSDRADAATELPDMAFGSGSDARHYAPTLSPLRDFRGLLVGHLLMLRDVTDQRQAQARLLEQQQVMTILSERERLARELHDGMAQALAASHFQASTAKLLLAQGETTQAAGCLDDLAAMTLQVEADVREYLLGAKTVISADRQFFPTLREYFVRFTRQYGLPIELTVPSELEEQGLAPAVEVQLLRIIQEALSNVRKHAQAQAAQVCFTVGQQQLRVAIVDDGRGFDPVAVASGGGYGLRAMRERAEALGGSLTVCPGPAQGTEVVVLLPSRR